MNRSKCIPVLAALVALLLTSCATKAPHYDFRELARAAIALDLDIAPEDNHQLYVTAADWIGVPIEQADATTGARIAQDWSASSSGKLTTARYSRTQNFSGRKTAGKSARSTFRKGTWSSSITGATVGPPPM